METFTGPKECIENPRYHSDRLEILGSLDLGCIDRPIVELVQGFTALPQCFTVQSCYGHFLHGPEQGRHNLERLSPGHGGQIHYRIAYMAFCIDNSPRGWELRESLELIPSLDPDYVQFGSADWFWERYPNSYVLQVEPARYRTKDQVDIEHSEAAHIERARDLFFIGLRELSQRCLSEHRAG